jgi:RNA polymerase sigma-70 factor (ECF subfamily)
LIQVSSDGDRRLLVDALSRAAAGDKAAFRDLYDRTSAKLYGTILRILRDEALSRDVLQEVYVKIWQKAADFDPDVASPVTWMATIARNRALDEVRRARLNTVSATRDDGDELDFAAELTHPLDGRERSEELRRLLGCLDTLDAERRDVVLLAYYRGMSREALSKRFNRPVPTIKTWLHRSLAQLKGCLQS